MDIAAIDYWANGHRSPLHRASPLGKGTAALAFVAAVVLASDIYLLVAAYLLLLAGVFVSRLPARRLVMIAAYPTVFALLFAVSRWNGSPVEPAIVLLKALTAAQAMVLLITTTPYTDLFAAVGRLLPALLADGLFMTYRSFFLLLRDMDHMVTSLRLRGGLRPGKYASNARNLAGALGMLLVRAMDLAERLYFVLRIRGYRGRLPAGDRWRTLSGSDVIPLTAGGVALLLAVFAMAFPGLWARAGALVSASAACVAAMAYVVSARGPAGTGVLGETRSPHPDPLPTGGAEDGGGTVRRLGEEVARVSCVRHLYPDGTEVSLCGLDFIACRGERVVILGPNGAGKSTLLNHLLGLLRPTEGEVSVLGCDPARQFAAIQPRLGVLLQDVDDQLLGPTVADDVAFGARNAGFDERKSREMAATAMRRLGVTHLADKVPHYLSGGEKRKVALAGALVTDPELLVLDEPFEGLDPHSRNDLVELLGALCTERGLTLIVTTHHVDLLPVLADVVYVLADGGRIVASGTPEEVFSQTEVLKESNIEAPLLTLLFQKLRTGGLDLGQPVDVEDAARRLLLASAKGQSSIEAGSSPESVARG